MKGETSILRDRTPFEDPKAFDNTPPESAMYDERTRPIARELLSVFADVSHAKPQDKRVQTLSREQGGATISLRRG